MKNRKSHIRHALMLGLDGRAAIIVAIDGDICPGAEARE